MPKSKHEALTLPPDPDSMEQDEDVHGKLLESAGSGQ